MPNQKTQPQISSKDLASNLGFATNLLEQQIPKDAPGQEQQEQPQQQGQTQQAQPTQPAQSTQPQSSTQPIDVVAELAKFKDEMMTQMEGIIKDAKTKEDATPGNIQP